PSRTAEADEVADSILGSAEEVMRQRDVHNGDIRLAHDIVIGKVPPRQQRRLHGCKIAGSYGRLLDVHIFVFAVVVSGDHDVTGVIVVGEIGIVGSGNGARARERRKRLQNAAVQGEDLFSLITSQSWVDA